MDTPRRSYKEAPDDVSEPAQSGASFASTPLSASTANVPALDPRRIRRFRRAWRLLLIAYNTFWEKQFKALNLADNQVSPALSPTRSEENSAIGTSTLDLMPVLGKEEIQALLRALDEQMLINPVGGSASGDVSRDEHSLSPHDDADVRKATKKWLALLRDHPDGDPFQGISDEHFLFSLRPRLGGVRQIRREWLTPGRELQDGDEYLPGVDYIDHIEFFVAPGPISTIDEKVMFNGFKMIDEDIIFDIFPFDIQTRPTLTEISLADLSEQEFKQWAAYPYWEAIGVDLDSLRSLKRIVRRRRPLESQSSKQNARQKILSLKRWRELQVTLLDPTRMRPSPVELVRYYNSSEVTEAQRQQIICALTGWVSASTIGSYVTGERQHFSGSHGGRHKKSMPSSQSLLPVPFTSLEFLQSLVSYVAETCEKWPPPALLNRDVTTRQEWMESISTIASYGSARISLWAYCFVTMTVQNMGKDKKLRHGLAQNRKNTTPAHSTSSPSTATMPLVKSVSLREARQMARVGVTELLNKATPQEENVFKMHAIQGYTRAEIAAELGISAETVKKHLQNARRRMTGKIPPSTRQD